MAWQIPTLAIGCLRVGARRQAKTKGSKALADCVRRDTIWHLARVLMKRSYFLFTRSTLRSFLEGRLRQVRAAAARERAGAATAGTAMASYLVYHRADAVHRATRGAHPVPWAKHAVDQEMAVALTSPEIMREP